MQDNARFAAPVISSSVVKMHLKGALVIFLLMGAGSKGPPKMS